MGPRSPFIGSTNYRSWLASNSGNHHDYGFYHHTQNGYSLDINPAHVTTYSGSAMITNTDVGNVTLNGFGATNANFQQDIGEQNMFDPSNIVATSDANAIGMHLSITILWMISTSKILQLQVLPYLMNMAVSFCFYLTSLTSSIELTSEMVT
ncbi:hypothetical protein MTR67_053683 [Solanum verrucosum]|uniref:Uncharacterized protein n=1 Tax=Solanum verrucosum TaxID=315347 RepID=A0AAF0VB55_SOLVR|nr:hypothetical protein MTR67_053683 [Solanum verrucosum]